MTASACGDFFDHVVDPEWLAGNDEEAAPCDLRALDPPDGEGCEDTHAIFERLKAVSL